MLLRKPSDQIRGAEYQLPQLLTSFPSQLSVAGAAKVVGNQTIVAGMLRKAEHPALCVSSHGEDQRQSSASWSAELIVSSTMLPVLLSDLLIVECFELRERFLDSHGPPSVLSWLENQASAERRFPTRLARRQHLRPVQRSNTGSLNSEVLGKPLIDLR